MGMITTACLDEGLCFGPLPTDLMIADPAYLIAQTTADQLSELPTVIANPQKLSDPMRLIEWVCNLRSARNPLEQNVELIRLPATGQSFYHLTRRVEPGEELFVWFRRLDLSPLLGELLFADKRAQDAWNGELPRSKNDGYDHASQFICGRCGASFVHIYPYVCHVLFKCTRQPAVHHGPGPKSCVNPIPEPDLLHLTISPNLVHTNQLSLAKPTAVHSHTDPGENRPPLIDRPMNCLVPAVLSGPVANSPVVEPNESGHSSLKHCPPPKEHDLTRAGARFGPEDTAAAPSKLPRASLPSRSLSTFTRLDVSATTTRGRRPVPLPTTYTHKASTCPTVRTRNPLVEQLLQTLNKEDPMWSSGSAGTAVSFAPGQNWCARCSVSFRLTSDLVQHMRTHHNNDKRKVAATACAITGSGLTRHEDQGLNKRGSRCLSVSVGEEDTAGSSESCNSGSSSGTRHSSSFRSFESPDRDFDRDRTSHGCVNSAQAALKPDTDRLLSCHLCGEMFRERHHLTRHMISHS